MSWVYHCAHLLSTMRTVLTERLGGEGERIVAAGLHRFSDRYGRASLETITARARSGFAAV